MSTKMVDHCKTQCTNAHQKIRGDDSTINNNIMSLTEFSPDPLSSVKNIKNSTKDSKFTAHFKKDQHTPHDTAVKRKRNSSEHKDFLLTPVHVRLLQLPEVSWADSTELSLLMCYKEDVIAKERDPNMFQRHPTLTPRMRAILLDWLMEVCSVYKLRRVTYYLTVDYLDRYLSCVTQLQKNQLQLLGITCLFIASKVEEIYPPKLAELAYVTDGACTVIEMLLKEIAILQTLNWDVHLMTVASWLKLYMQICFNSKNIRDSDLYQEKNDDFVFPQFSAYAFIQAAHLVDLCSLDDGMTQFPYSIIAASAVYYIFNREKALYVSGFTWNEIKDCVTWMEPFYKVTKGSPALNVITEDSKKSPRGGSGLKKANPNILVNEAHALQTHTVSLTMLDDVHEIISNYQVSGSSQLSYAKNSPQIPSDFSIASSDDDADILQDVKNDGKIYQCKRKEKSSHISD